jgi:hypothetical protein
LQSKRREQTGGLHVLSLADGQIVEKIPLAVPPVLEGLSVAYGRLFVSLLDGTIVCLSKKR